MFVYLAGGGGKKGKSASQQTISQGHRVINSIYSILNYQNMYILKTKLKRNNVINY